MLEKLDRLILNTSELLDMSLPSDKELKAHYDHEYYMQQAIKQALKNSESPYGAVLVDQSTGQIIAAGYNQAVTNPVLHGEIVAIQQCADNHPNIDWGKLILYTTAEPCAMCQAAIAWAGIAEVYYGVSIPFLQSQNKSQIDVRAVYIAEHTPFRKISIYGGLLKGECEKLFQKR